MANSELKLYYFEGKGRAETARLIMTAVGKKFENITFSFEEWPKYKTKAPFGQGPYMEIDGQAFAQSLAINSFLAREFGLYGKTNLEALAIDQVVNLIEDLARICVDAIHIEDKDEQKVQIQKIKEEKSPTFLGHLEKLLEANGTGYFVGNAVTLADIAVFDMATGMLESFTNIDDNYPLLKKNIEAVRGFGNIGPYVASRPESDF